MAQPRAGSFILGGRARNLWRDQSRRPRRRRRRRPPPPRRDPRRRRAHRRGPDRLDMTMRARLRPKYAHRLVWRRGPGGELSYDSLRGTPELSTPSPRLVFRRELFSDGLGARKPPPGAGSSEKPAVVIFSRRPEVGVLLSADPPAMTRASGRPSGTMPGSPKRLATGRG